MLNTYYFAAHLKSCHEIVPQHYIFFPGYQLKKLPKVALRWVDNNFNFHEWMVLIIEYVCGAFENNKTWLYWSMVQFARQNGFQVKVFISEIVTVRHCLQDIYSQIYNGHRGFQLPVASLSWNFPSSKTLAILQL